MSVFKNFFIAREKGPLGKNARIKSSRTKGTLEKKSSGKKIYFSGDFFRVQWHVKNKVLHGTYNCGRSAYLKQKLEEEKKLYIDGGVLKIGFRFLGFFFHFKGCQIDKNECSDSILVQTRIIFVLKGLGGFQRLKTSTFLLFFFFIYPMKYFI